jgi:hypothetical protein
MLITHRGFVLVAGLMVALLMFADYLLRLVDERVSAQKPAAGTP